MENEMIFTANSLFDDVTFDKKTDIWRFYFANKIYANSYGFWRLLRNDKIVFVSFDNEQQFGLSKPLDLVVEIRHELAGKRLTKIEVLKGTFDLILTLSDGLRLEIFIASSGYETYDFSINNKRYIGLGSGDIAIFNNQN